MCGPRSQALVCGQALMCGPRSQALRCGPCSQALTCGPRSQALMCGTVPRLWERYHMYIQLKLSVTCLKLHEHARTINEPHLPE